MAGCATPITALGVVVVVAQSSTLHSSSASPSAPLTAARFGRDPYDPP